MSPGPTRSAGTQGSPGGDLGLMGEHPMAPARRGKPPRHPALHHPGSQPQLTQAPGSLEDIFAILLFFFPPLFWVLVATIRLYLVVAIRDYSLLWYTDSSSQQLSHRFCGVQASVVAAPGGLEDEVNSCGTQA